MKKLSVILNFGLLALLICAGNSLAAVDLYLGDTDIYNGSSDSAPAPNVMFVIDNTAGMEQNGVRETYRYYEDDGVTQAPYYPGSGTVAAPAPYDPEAVYQRKAATGGVINYIKVVNDASTISCTVAKESLLNNGAYFGPFKASDGSCNAPKNGNYYLGNQLNYILSPTDATQWTASTVYSAGDVVYGSAGNAATGPFYECVSGATSGATEPTWPTAAGDTVVDPPNSIGAPSRVTWALTGDLLSMVQATVKQVAAAVRDTVKVGLMTFSDNGVGGRLAVSIENIEPDITTSGGVEVATMSAAQSAFNAAVDALTLLPGNSTQPVNEALWDAGIYFKGPADFATAAQRLGTPGNDATYSASPIDESCQKNIVILITTGSQDNDTHFTTLGINDLMTSGGSGGHIYVDDVAKYLNSPFISGSDGIGSLVNGAITNTEGVQTHIIQLLTAKVDRLETATKPGVGGGGYYSVSNNRDLLDALLNSFAEIMKETDTAFVAPVVPTSPENRTYSGQRVYLGFFYPKNDEPWYGNLKKFGISDTGVITDKGGAPATEANGDFKDEDNGSTTTASSFWSTSDAGRVNEGGVGQILRARNFTSDTGSGHRNIYTYLTPANSTVTTADPDLTDSQNSFSTGNADIVFNTTLGLTVATDKNKLISFVHGLDSYDDDGDSVTTELRPWIMGDILHSKPQVVNYTSYTFTDENEVDCTVNKATVYVGANDGMLHAFADCNGSERWAFIPPEVLPNLQEVRGTKHPYFVDGTPVVYKYDADNDGNIETGDKVILIFGMRRGGEAYYALDVTDPAAPVYLWQVDSNSGFSELGQTWSTPNLGKVKDASGNPMVVAFVGAGYDNLNEDGRFGNTQGFTNADVVTTVDSSGAVTSAVTLTPTRDSANSSSVHVTNHPKGRGVYAFKIADLNATTGVPTIATSAVNVWDFVYDDSDTGGTRVYNSFKLDYSIPSDLTVMDTNFDGFVDRLYVGDTGGQLWRISAYDDGGGVAGIDQYRPYATSSIGEWLGKRVFLANGTGDGSTGTNGRKIFYRPSVTIEKGGVFNLYFGTGDRAHPLNSAVTDRMYSVFDRGQKTSEMIDEDNLVDVTENLLQEASGANVTSTLSALQAATNYGWFIKLNETGHAGEKVLAQPLAFNKVAYYTTYAPSVVNPSPCDPGNLGVSRLYAVDYLTGEAVLNFNNADNTPSTNNDTQSTSGNTRASDGNGHVLRRADRSVDLGVGIPSGLVVLMPPSGDATLLIGCGGGLCTEDPVLGGTIYPIYWRPY